MRFGQGRVFEYDATYAETKVLQGVRKPMLGGLDAFADSVYEFLSGAIDRQYPAARAKKAMSHSII